MFPQQYNCLQRSALVLFHIQCSYTVAAKKGEEQKDAWIEQLKNRVKPLVHDELTVDKPGLRETQLIIRHEVVGPNRDKLRESIV